MSVPVGILTGVLLGLMITVLGAILLSMLIYRQTVQEDGVGIGAMIIVGVSALAGVIAAVTLVRRRRVQVCVLTGVGYQLSLLGMNALLFGGQYNGVMTTIILVSLAVVIGVFCGIGGEKTPKNHRRKRAYG